MSANYLLSTVVNLGRQGWKEEFYLPASSPAAALAVLQAVSPARLDLMAPGVSIDQLKVSDVAILGDSLADYSWPARRSKITALLTRDQATTSLLCRAYSVVAAGGGGVLQYQRAIELTGLPDEWTSYDANGAGQIPGTAGCPGAFKKAFDTWVLKVIANGLCIRSIDKAQPLKPIKGIGVNPNTVGVGSLGKIMVYCPGHGLTATNADGRQTSYRIKGVHFLPNLGDPKGFGPLDVHQKSLVNRVQMWQDITLLAGVFPTVNGVVTSATDWLQLAYDLPQGFPGLPLVYVGGGTVQSRIFAYNAITSIVPERFGSRDRGRAYFVPRGRARKRAC